METRTRPTPCGRRVPPREGPRGQRRAARRRLPEQSGPTFPHSSSLKERGTAPAPKIPQPERSSHVRFLAGLDGDGEAEGFELPDGAPALLFLTGLAHDASTGVLLGRAGGQQGPDA